MEKVSAFLVCLLLSMTILCGDSYATLVAYYSCEDTLTVNNNTVVNSAAESDWPDAIARTVGSYLMSGVGGIQGRAFEFVSNTSNTSCINTGHTLSATGNFTLMGWAKSFVNPANRGMIFGQYHNTVANGNLIFFASDKNNLHKARLYVSPLSSSGINLLSVAALNDGQWHFVAVTRSANTFTLYVDGTAEDSATVAGISLTQLSNLTIGNLSHIAVQCIETNGIYDELKVYDTALSSADILDAYGAEPAVFIEETDGATEIREGEYGDSYTMSLEFKPAANVSITANVSNSDVDLGSGGGIPATLTFTPSNWQMPQTIIVTALDDMTDKATRGAVISHSVVSADPSYNGIAAQSIAVTIYDDDYTDVLFYGADDLGVSEIGATSDTYSVSLQIAPLSTVTVSCTVNSEVIINPSVLAFTTSDWDTPQVVTVTAVQDEEIEEDPHVGLVLHTVSSGDSRYSGKLYEKLLLVHDRNCGSWGYYPGDVNHDCVVNLIDLAILALNWMQCSDPEGLVCTQP